MREVLCNILTKKISNENLNHSSLSNLFEESVQVDELGQDVPINIAEQSESISTPDFQTLSSIEEEEPNLTTNDNDESFWLDEKSDDDVNVWANSDMESLFKATCDDVSLASNSPLESINPSKKEIAAAMIILKTRHRISIKCVDDLCKLMHLLKVPNFPTSFASMNRLLMSESSSPLSIKSSYICPACYSTSGSSDHCDNNECRYYQSYSQTPFQSMTIPIISQLQDILSRVSKLNLEHQDNNQATSSSDTIMHDIYDGEVYQQIILNEKDFFLSFTMNIDGIQISKSSTNSLWIVTFAINEIKRTERFRMKNIIIGGILSTNVKPSREHIRVFLQPIVKELIQLEKGAFFEMKNLNINEPMFFKVFLIYCCADKPAQSLVQGLSEANGGFDCSRCELEGITVVIQEKSKKKIRVFPLLPSDQSQPRLRTNETYDEFMKIDNNKRLTKKTELRDQMRGHVGVCILRDLTHFDVGKSFLSDSLHNIYHGVMRRLLTLWLEKKYRKRPWSLSSKISTIDQYLSLIKYPTTSTRVPRSITKYYQFKGNELRAICLYGFPAFGHVLPMKYARHFLMLVIAVHLSESRSLDRNQVEDIQILLDRFLRQFDDLYINRHNTQAVHSLQHVASSVRDFGSLGNYSMFNFENILGLITSTIHSTRRHAQEIHNSLNVLRMACIELGRPSFQVDLRRFIQMIQSSKRSVLTFFDKENNQVEFRQRDEELNDLKIIQTALRQQNIQLYRSCYVSTIRFTIITYRTDGQQSDSCVLFILAGKPAVGFIVNIIETEQKQLFFRIHRISIKNKLYVTINNKQVTCPNVIHGNLEGEGGFVYIKQDAIIEKLIHTYDASLRCYIFFRIPNLCESS